MGTFVYKAGGAVAAGTWAVGDNVFAGNQMETDTCPRRISRIGFTGNDVAGECCLEIKYGKVTVGYVCNTTTTDVLPLDDDMQVVSSKLINRPNEPIALILREAGSTTNGLQVTVDIKDIVRARRRRRRF